MSALRIGIDARLVKGESGGVEHLLIGLASGLGRLSGDEGYLFFGLENHDRWIRPYLGRNSTMKLRPGGKADPEWKEWMRSKFPRVLQTWYGIRRRIAEVSWSLSPHLPEPQSDRHLFGLERLDVLHLPHCIAVRTDLPVVFEPHDLQHVHLPENFTPKVRFERDRAIRMMVESGARVVVASTWVKNDIIKHFGASPQSIHVVPLAPPLAVYRNPSDQELRVLEARYSLPKGFVFYPAQTWPHKNHKILLEAASILRGRNLRVELVFSGKLNASSSSLRLRAQRLGIASQVRFLGFVPSTDLFGLFRLARCVAIPTLFEAASFPMWEAFLAGTPVVSSTVTSLPAQSGGAARHFDPRDALDVANALEEVIGNDELREKLVLAGSKRVQEFDWTKTATMFRALYRMAAGRSLAADERLLLAAPPIM